MSLDPQAVAPGQEQFEYFTRKIAPGRERGYCRYYYRYSDGTLFSCTAPNVKEAREMRDAWCKKFPMTETEYTKTREAERYICPRCRGGRITETVPLQWERHNGDATAIARLYCDACQARWTEILRPIGFEMDE